MGKKKYTTWPTSQLYAELKANKCGPARADNLVELFAKSATVEVENIKTGIFKRWRDNYMREHAGCAFGAKFTNTISPMINELVFRKYPQFRKYENDDDDGDDLFDGGR